LLYKPPLFTPYLSKCLIDSAYFKDEFVELEKAFNSKYIYFTNSGSASLLLILESLKKIHPHKKQVIIPAYTCPKVAQSVHNAGLELVLCDLVKEGFELNANNLDKLINENTLVIINQYLFGVYKNLTDISKIAKKNQIPLIDDCCQMLVSPDVKFEGDFLIYSFSIGKQLTSITGGAVCVNDSKYNNCINKIYEKCKEYSCIEIIRDLIKLILYPILLSRLFYTIICLTRYIPEKKIEFDPKSKTKLLKLSRLHKNILMHQMSMRNEIKSTRKWNYKYFKRNLSFKNDYATNDLLRLPLLLSKCKLPVNYFKYGISKLYFHDISNLNFTYKNQSSKFKNANEVAKRLVVLPIHSRISINDQKKIIQFISSYL